MKYCKYYCNLHSNYGSFPSDSRVVKVRSARQWASMHMMSLLYDLQIVFVGTNWYSVHICYCDTSSETGITNMISHSHQITPTTKGKMIASNTNQVERDTIFDRIICHFHQIIPLPQINTKHLQLQIR